MRTAQVLKHLAFGVLVVGVLVAFRSFDLRSVEFWAVVFASLLGCLILRLFANIGQLVYEIRNDALRELANMERALYHQYSLIQEIRDLMDSKSLGNTSDEDRTR